MAEPKILLLLSGKRKCGKDFLSNLLLSKLGTESAEIIRISEPIKSHWAREKGLDLDQLLSDGPYKEQYRKEMIVWSDHVRSTDPGYFCRAAINKSTKPIVIISDIRRKTDIKFFKDESYNFRTIRITVSDELRLKRGWVFEDGVDNVPSECDLDDFNEWDLVLENHEGANVDSLLSKIIQLVPGQ